MEAGSTARLRPEFKAQLVLRLLRGCNKIEGFDALPLQVLHGKKTDELSYGGLLPVPQRAGRCGIWRGLTYALCKKFYDA